MNKVNQVKKGKKYIGLYLRCVKEIGKIHDFFYEKKLKLERKKDKLKLKRAESMMMEAELDFIRGFLREEIVLEIENIN